MHKSIIITAETGSDLTPELAAEHGIYLVPMHVSMGDQSLDDGAFPPEDVCAYYDRTHTVPRTSGSSPEDFARVYHQIRQDHPNCQILHLAYSAVTTCSYQSAVIAAEGDPDIIAVDTRHVSVGQAVAVLETARYLEDHPSCSLQEAAHAAAEISEKIQMCFIPMNLDYLRAGGRVSNATAMVGNLLGLHPCIEILEGRLLAKKKYRGRMDAIIPHVLKDFTEKYDIAPNQLYFIWSPGLTDFSRQIADSTAAELGFANVSWMKTGCVITCHGGPGCFGIVGMCR